MVVPLHHPERVFFHVLARHKPRRVVAAAALCTFGLEAANAQSLALAQCVKAQAHVLADGLSLVVLDRARLLGDIAVQKVSERPLADEADAGLVLLLCVGQADLKCQAAHLGLVQFADREQCFRELVLAQPVQEIALVF